jgi:dTDP-4-amino-4,6-dideoxygalactose transaminase
MSGNEIKYINDAFEHNWVAPLGPNVDALEESLARYCGVKHAAALSSGTAALHLALIMLGVEQGDEVIASTFTFAATINPIIYQGATPVFIDSEPGTWNMDPVLLDKAIRERMMIGKKPKAIIPVHIYGMPANMEAIMNIADRYDIPVVGDAAEALGSRFKGKPVASYGKMSILSFNGNKIITTSGGGALVSDDENLIRRARFLATQAKDNAPYYQHSNIGYNYRMSNIVAGIGRGQMEVIDERVQQRRNNYYYYKETLSSFDWLTFMEEPGKEYFSNHWLTVALVDPARTGTTPIVLQKEMDSMNIESRVSWKPMHLQPIFSSYPAYLNGTSEKIFYQGLCLPSGSNMTVADLELVTTTLIKCLSSHVRRRSLIFVPVSNPVDVKAV